MRGLVEQGRLFKLLLMQEEPVGVPDGFLCKGISGIELIGKEGQNLRPTGAPGNRKIVPIGSIWILFLVEGP